MRARRLIVSAILFALLAGQTAAASSRSACAMRRGAAPPACALCAATPQGTSLTVSADRSCCAVPAAPADREPALAASDRSPEVRPAGPAFLLAIALPHGGSAVPSATPRFESPPPESSPPHSRTTILLI